MLKLLTLLLLVEASFAFIAHAPLISRRFSTKANALGTLVTAIAEAKPDGYVYGAVAAPDWALPVGLVLIIATAAIPLLLSPGEKALSEQRANEETKGVTFGRKNRSEDL